MSINSPMKPKSIIRKADGTMRYVCPQCGLSFLKSPRCPECGQLVSVNAVESGNDRKLCVGDDVSELKIFEIINKYFGEHYKGWMKAWYNVSDEYAAWFPTITVSNTKPSGNWGGTMKYSNTLSPDRKTITEMNHEKPNGIVTSEEFETWGKKRRLVFARVNGSLVFLGVFQTFHDDGPKVKTFVHKRIAKGIDLSTFELIDEDQ